MADTLVGFTLTALTNSLHCAFGFLRPFGGCFSVPCCKTSGSNSTAGLLEFTGAFTAVTFTLVLKSSVKTFSSSCNAAFTASVLLVTAWSAGIFSISILERCNLTCWIPITTITHYGPSKSGVPTACFSRTPLKSTRHGSFRRLRSRSWWLISFPDGLPKRGV